MDKQPFNKKKDPNFQDPSLQKAFLEGTENREELFQKELSVNHSEQNLLIKRVALMKELLNALPSSDPQYNLLKTQIEMDEIELNELKARALTLMDFFEE